ncbi:hypothetical protein OPV22_021422 [Ensete ventricosum]|uniref:PHD finger protein ALFIN-LIKE n=1 Tax=Ensete ventricosum TaxID=4639 RepID=A0AAV8PB27_ENSVE|nr:hypothetical protein OPV22_021422 [Ensete ventricosum]
MDEENIDYYVWTVDQIFRDFLGRRAGLIEALTILKKFHTKCDPAVKMAAKEETSGATRGKDDDRAVKLATSPVILPSSSAIVERYSFSLPPAFKSRSPLTSIEEEEDVENEAEQMAAAATHSVEDGCLMTPEYWIFCDECGKWYHGNCVRVTPERYKQLLRVPSQESDDLKPRPLFRSVDSSSLQLPKRVVVSS